METAKKKIERSGRGGGSGRAAERGFGPSSNCGQAKNLYTRSERLAVSCRVIWASSKRFNMQDSRVPEPDFPSGSSNPGNLRRFSHSRQHWPATAVEVVVYAVATVVVVVVVVVVIKCKETPLQTQTRPEGSRRLRLPDFKTMGT